MEAHLPFEQAVVGTRIELHPATDRWMMGDRYGIITGINVTTSGVRVRARVEGRR